MRGDKKGMRGTNDLYNKNGMRGTNERGTNDLFVGTSHPVLISSPDRLSSFFFFARQFDCRRMPETYSTHPVSIHSHILLPLP
jgi:hypothetical protein